MSFTADKHMSQICLCQGRDGWSVDQTHTYRHFFSPVRAGVKLLEESGSQREARARQENEDLAERLAAVTRMAEQERAELQAQNQRRLAQCQQDRDREVERLRDLQRCLIYSVYILVQKLNYSR